MHWGSTSWLKRVIEYRSPARSSNAPEPTRLMVERTEAACKIRIVRHHTQIFFHECIVDAFGFCKVGPHLGTQLTLSSVPGKGRRPRQTVRIGNLEEKICPWWLDPRR